MMNLKRAMVGALALAAMGATGAHAANTVVNFDDLQDGVVPDGYGGITWGGLWDVYSEDQDPYNASSYPARIYNDYGYSTPGVSGDVAFSFSAPVVFKGADVSGGYYEGVQFLMFNGATLVHTSAVLDQSSTPTFLASGYNGKVTSVEVRGVEDYYVLDDVTYNAGVPEPATWAMMLVGFGALGGAMRMARRRQTDAAAA